MSLSHLRLKVYLDRMIAVLLAALIVHAAVPIVDLSQDATAYDPELPRLDDETTLGLVTPFLECAAPLVTEYTREPAAQRSSENDGAFLASIFQTCPAEEILELAFQAHRLAHPKLTDKQARQAAAQSVSLAMVYPIVSRVAERPYVVEPPENRPCWQPDGSLGVCGSTGRQ